MDDSLASSARAREDEALIARVAQGEAASFSALYDRFATPLYSLAIKILASEAEAQDVLQEVFLAIWNKAESYRPERGSVFSWAATLLRNRAIDRLRARQRRAEFIDANAPELEPTSSAVASADEACETSERAREVRAALAEISEEQGRVLRLAYFEGLTQAEIAEKLREPLGTIKARAHRGLARLRALLRSRHD